MEEKLVLVDFDDNPIGTETKEVVHRDGLLHRAFSIFIFNHRGELLLQKRARGKYHSAGLWSNTCCGHPLAGETTIMAALRRLDEEMGFHCDLYKVSSLLYQGEVSNDLFEYEYDYIFSGFFSKNPIINYEEAESWRWVEFKQLINEIKIMPEIYTIWLRKILAEKTIDDLQSWVNVTRSGLI